MIFLVRPKYSNHIILVSTHIIYKLKIVMEIYWSREFMVRNPFLYFECFTFGNPCDSSTSPRDNFWPVTPEKFLRHGFLVFHLNLPFSLVYWSSWHFGFLIYKTLHPTSNNHLELKLKFFLTHEEKIVFEKILTIESILSQFFIQFQFHVQI